MARPSKIHSRDIAVHLMARGPASASDMAASLRVNRSTITRTLTDLGPQVTSLGATRSTRYALRRQIRNLSPEWPIYRIDPGGHAHLWSILTVFHGAWHLQWPTQAPAWAPLISDPDGLCQGFPFFLSDVRPQGFLGRAIARRLSTSHFLPDNPTHWSDDDTLVFLATAGADLPGDLVIGDDCLRQALDLLVNPSPINLVQPGQEPLAYPGIAALAGTNPPPGSSAGGEQPKFTAILQTPERRQLLVKFSPPLSQQTGRRWADLLLMEHHALTVLAEIGLTTPGHRIIDAEDRRFLEAPRFDRTPQGGRHGIVSLNALHAATIDDPARSWSESLSLLRRAHIVDDASVHQALCLQSFGELIGNTDMHPGNLSFRLSDQLPFQLAPAYDMLPMFWAPGPQGELIDRPFQPTPPIPSQINAWRQMLNPARQFWSRCLNDNRLSQDTVIKCLDACQTLDQLAARHG
jgi:hypothetical protein